METIETLYLDFIDEEGKKRTIGIDDPLETVDSEDIQTTMDLIIAKDVFEEFKLVAKSGARLVTRTIENIDMP